MFWKSSNAQKNYRLFVSRPNCAQLKDDFQFVLRRLRTLVFINIINGSLDGMRIDVIRWEPHTLSLRPFKSVLFQQLHNFYSCTVISWSEMRKKEALSLRILNGGCFLTLNLRHVSSCRMFRFCVVFHEIKQKTYVNSWECAARTGNHLKAVLKNIALEWNFHLRNFQSKQRSDS